MRENIFAHTDPGTNYPQYVSINKEEDGKISLTVRSAVWGDGTCGATATAVLSLETVRKLAQSLEGL
jgi:hypothetical protein